MTSCLTKRPSIILKYTTQQHVFQKVAGLVIKPAGSLYGENSYTVTNGVYSHKDLKDKVSKFEPRNITGTTARCLKDDSKGA